MDTSIDQHSESSMKKVVYRQFGERDVLQVVSSDMPSPQEGEVLIRVHGAGLNPIDWKTRKGFGFVAQQIESSLPWTPGYDVAGEVVAIGDGVTTLAPRDRVMGMIGFPLDGGGYSEYALARADELAIVPEELDLVTAGALPLAALTAWQALFEVDFLAELGVHEVIDYHTTDIADECYGLDVVLDLVGGDTGKRSLRTLGENGMLVTVPTITADEIISAAEELGLKAHGMTVRPDVFHLDEIAELIEDGDVKVHIEKAFSLDQVAQAHELLEGGHVRGKLVLDCR